jgi:CRISPR-associated protein Cas6
VTDTTAAMVDVSFALTGDAPPREHRRVLAAALEARLPWLAELPGCGVHRLNVSAGGGPQALLSQRTRLTLRVPRERTAAATALEGQALQLGPATLHVGAARVRELLPWGTLYAHLVAADAHGNGDGDEIAFLRAVDDELAALGAACRPICGRLQVLESGALRGYGLMLDRLSAADSLRLLQAGLGAHRRLGCGLFVPHRSAAAVGSPP